MRVTDTAGGNLQGNPECAKLYQTDDPVSSPNVGGKQRAKERLQMNRNLEDTSGKGRV